MRDRFDAWLASAKSWCAEQLDGGWLGPQQHLLLEALDQKPPASLFDEDEHRPLLVSFFGGTGVGKSSLLNRLAGQAVARVGLERPTSREVSLYLHSSLRLERLAAQFPLDSIRVARHGDDRNRQIVWLDMPDVDSTEARNHSLVEQWLPHVDVVIYVVSPERYRDDKAWRLLQGKAAAHAWLFAFNHWDEGRPEQVDDFRLLLHSAGFENPELYRTDCREDQEARRPDEFAALAERVHDLANRHVLEQLQRVAEHNRQAQVAGLLSEAIAAMGDETALAQLQALWGGIWRQTATELREGLVWPIEVMARRLAEHQTELLGKPVRHDQMAEGESAPRKSMLWDDWASLQLQDALDRLLIEIAPTLPTAPLKRELQAFAAQAPTLILRQTELTFRKSMAAPGTRRRRLVLKLSGLCAWLLPLAAIGWVSYEVVTGFYDSQATHRGYLGIDFAIHSGLLIVISWLLPYFLYRKCRPSAEYSAKLSLQRGFEASLMVVESGVAGLLESYAAQWRERVAVGQALLAGHAGHRPSNLAPELTRLLASASAAEDAPPAGSWRSEPLRSPNR